MPRLRARASRAPGTRGSAASDGTAVSSPYTLTGSTTLYAQWTANPTDTVFRPLAWKECGGITHDIATSLISSLGNCVERVDGRIGHPHDNEPR